MDKTYKHYIIYRVTNTVNNKIYIGKHKCDKLDDNYFGSGKLLLQAIEKYGLEKFTFHMEIDLKNQEEMDLLEEIVVNEDFLLREDVYNISKGGKNPCMFGKNNPFFGKTHSAEFCQKMSKIHKGKKLTEEHREKISKGGKRRYEEHPEQLKKCATRTGKCKHINIVTNEIRFFKEGTAPDGFIKFVPPPPQHVSDEQKALNREKCRQRNKKSKWYNNGIKETFCIVGTQPEGYVLGRLPGINVGRKCSVKTLEKMSKSHKGKKANCKGKILVTNGVQNKYIDPSEQLEDGWRRGMTRLKNIKLG